MTQLGLTKRELLLLGVAGAAAAFTAGSFGSIRPAFAAAKVGVSAPAFTAIDSNGKTHALADFKGKTVILEWTNHECPFVEKHYGTKNMQRLQKQAAEAGIVWLSIISSAPGTQGYVQGDEANRIGEEQKSVRTATLLDPAGTVGRAYDARTTPHMYIIDAGGNLVYMGGIDDRPTANWADVKGARNYIRAALADMAAGRPIAAPVTRPYGCSVKYDSTS